MDTEEKTLGQKIVDKSVNIAKEEVKNQVTWFAIMKVPALLTAIFSAWFVIPDIVKPPKAGYGEFSCLTKHGLKSSSDFHLLKGCKTSPSFQPYIKELNQ